MNDEHLKAAEVLRNGGIVIFPTDTAFGIGCRIDREDAVKRIYEIRNRPEEKALLALVSSYDMAKEYVVINEQTERELRKYWPGGLSVILPCNVERVPPGVRSDGNTLAVRLPNHTDLNEIIMSVGVPIVAPSANYSGESTPTKLFEVDESLKAQVDFVLSGVCTMEGVSTIADATVWPWRVMRKGVVNL